MANREEHHDILPFLDYDRESVTVNSFNGLCHESKLEIERTLREAGLTQTLPVGSFDNLQVPKSIDKDGTTFDLVILLEAVIASDKNKGIKPNTGKIYPTEINFDDINAKALQMADHIATNSERLITVLTKYETHEVAHDEIERTLDLLRSLHENKSYFKRRIGGVGSFLPINQPLYALTCFSIVPALMAERVLVRPPVISRGVFSEINDALRLGTLFPNVVLSNLNRANFIGACKSENVEVIIFTGKMENAYKVRKSFNEDVLFIVNGAGHNPIVVAANADLDSAVNSTLRVQLYNQGQDCANPSAILVHSDVAQQFLEKLRKALSEVIVGHYQYPKVRVGPISNPKDLGRITALLNKNRRFIDPATLGMVHTETGIVEPTIINKPLAEGGNYDEQLAPIFFLHRYESDDDLADYFENDAYSPNAMYVSLFGSSEYVDGLSNLHFSDGRKLHTEAQIIRNKDLHSKGVERGTQPYGGYGRRASCLIVNGRLIPKPTLPQRDIFEHLVQPEGETLKKTRMAVERTLVLKGQPKQKNQENVNVLKEKNISYISKIGNVDKLHNIREFRNIIANGNFDPTIIMEHAHRLSKKSANGPKEFFRDLYNLLIGQDAGPRISTLINNFDRELLLTLLDV